MQLYSTGGTYNSHHKLLVNQQAFIMSSKTEYVN